MPISIYNKLSGRFLGVNAAILMVISIMAAPAAVSAHVLIKDTSGQVGVIFHVTPDDDPVAGEQSVLYFSPAKAAPQLNASNYLYTVRVTDNADFTDIVQLTSNGVTIYTAYTFPHRGVYRLKLTMTPKVTRPDIRTYTLNYDIGVSRGLNDGSDTADTSPVAEVSAVITLCLLICFRLLLSDHRSSARAKVMFDPPKK